MMTCKQVSTILSHGELRRASLFRRLAIRVHLSMCDKCSAFRQWLEAIERTGRVVSRGDERDAPADMEARVLRRIERSTDA